MKIVCESLYFDEIPALQIFEPDICNAPIIFFIPGYGGTKESGISLGYQLALRGFFFVRFDPVYHGERFDPILFNAALPEYGGIYPAGTGLDTTYLFFRIIQHCEKDVRKILDAINANPKVNSNNCGVIGLSMGGGASFLITSNLSEIKAAVPIIGIPSFSRRWQNLLDECRYSNPEWASLLAKNEIGTEKRTKFIKKIDPSQSARNLAQKALFIMNCDFDTDQPKHYSIDFFKELSSCFPSENQKIKLRIYPTGHEVTSNMEKEAVDWFVEHLA